MAKLDQLMDKDEFFEGVTKYNPRADIRLINTAYDFAFKAHDGQKRLSGDPYFVHLSHVALLLAELGMDSQTVAAGLLHDVIEDTKITSKDIQKEFGTEIYSLIEGVTKITNVKFESEEENRAANIRKVFLATIKDIRVIIIKITDRLHNMRTLKYMNPKQREEIARETLEIYVPIAYKLGMYRIKSELEDLCFKFLQPQIYQSLKKGISRKKEEREKEVSKIIEAVQDLLERKNLSAEVSGRAKNFYSTYKKMKNKGIDLHEVRDLAAIRIITETKDDCYKIMDAIHSEYTPILNNFDDYISNPKPNMYQSLHTEIIFEEKPVEVQIRTSKMHHLAEEGIAAHWRYHKTENDKKFDRRVAWLKQILDWQTKESAKDYIEKLKIDLFKEEIVVLTPKGDPITLPEGSTPIDFAFAVHSDIGKHCKAAKVNTNVVTLDTPLTSGDVVEIVTAKNAKPSRNWLKITKTRFAKAKIRSALGLVRDNIQPVKEEITNRIVSQMITGQGIKTNNLRTSGCCFLNYGDEVVGYKMKDGKIAIHKEHCTNLNTTEKNRIVKLEWKSRPKESKSKILAELQDRTGLFTDILNLFSSQGVQVDSINAKSKKGKFYAIFEVETNDKLDETLKKLGKIKNVISVKKE